MTICLDKKDLVTLVKGNSPGHDIMVKNPYLHCGDYSGSYGTWSWRGHELEKLSEEELWNMHVEMKNQYKR